MITIYVDIENDNSDIIVHQITHALNMREGIPYFQETNRQEMEKYISNESQVSDVISTSKCNVYITHDCYEKIFTSTDSWDIFVKVMNNDNKPEKRVAELYFRYAKRKGKYHALFFKKIIVSIDELGSRIGDSILLANMRKVNYRAEQILAHSFEDLQ